MPPTVTRKNDGEGSVRKKAPMQQLRVIIPPVVVLTKIYPLSCNARSYAHHNDFVIKQNRNDAFDGKSKAISREPNILLRAMCLDNSAILGAAACIVEIFNHLRIV
jgi:hypothetical protein